MAKQITCRDAGMDCDFVVRSDNESELVDFAQQHVRDVHDQEMSRSEMRGLLKDA